MKSVLVFLFLILLPFFSTSTPVKGVETFTAKLPTVNVVAKSGLLVAANGELEWLGKASADAKVYFADSCLKTITQRKNYRNLTAVEFLHRVWWVHGEGGGVLAKWYASAIENRTFIGIGGGKIAGEKETPSKAARAWIAGQKSYNGWELTNAYKFPKAVINAALDGNVKPFNRSKTLKGQKWTELSMWVGRAAIGKGVPHINGWAGDDYADGSVLDDVVRQGSGGLNRDAKIYVHQSGQYFHAFVAYKYKDLYPVTAAKVKPLMVNI